MLLKSPVSPSMCPVAIPEALAVVKVGNSECVLVNRTPRAISAVIAGAVAALTIPARRPSATNRMTLCGLGCARAGARGEKQDGGERTHGIDPRDAPPSYRATVKPQVAVL